MKLNDCSVEFHYSFRSGLGAYEEGRFLKEHQMRIVLTDGWGNMIQDIGEVKFLMIYIDQIFDADLNIFDVIDDHSEALATDIFKFIDTETERFNEWIMDYLDQIVIGSNICLIENIQILPSYRGYQIGAKALRDLLFHYTAASGLIMVQPYPLQFEDPRNVKDYDLLELEKLEQDEEMATLKLMAFYQKLGFEAVEGIEDLLFHNPALRHSELQKIDLEDDEIFKVRKE